MGKMSIKEKLQRFTAPQTAPQSEPREKREWNPEHEQTAIQVRKTRSRKPKALSLPEMNRNTDRVSAFLVEKCGLDAEIVEEMIEAGIVYEDKKGNSVFVGYDTDMAKYGLVCGSGGANNNPIQMELSGSHKLVGWSVPAAVNGELLQVFEYPIDALQKMSEEKQAGIPWNSKHHLAGGGVYIEPIYYYIKKHPEITTIAFCYGDDVAGRAAAEENAAKLRTTGKTCYIEVMKK